MPTITMTQFAAELAEKMNVTPAEAKRWLDAQEQLEDMHLSQGDTIRNTGRWTLELSHRPPRQTVIGFGEQKGQKKKVPEHYRPQFSISSTWRDEMTAARKRAERRAKAAERRGAKTTEAPAAKPAADESAATMATLSAQLAEVNARIAERATAGKQPLKRDMERLSALQTQLQALTPAPTRRGRGRKAQAQAA